MERSPFLNRVELDGRAHFPSPATAPVSRPRMGEAGFKAPAGNVGWNASEGATFATFRQAQGRLLAAPMVTVNFCEDLNAPHSQPSQLPLVKILPVRHAPPRKSSAMEN